MKLPICALIISLLFINTSAHAGFVDTDWNTTGDAKATLHEETGLEWLKFDNTNNSSVNQVIALLDTTYDGWRLPTMNEVNALADAITGTTAVTSGEYIVPSHYPQLWFNAMGISAAYNTNNISSYGFHIDENDNTVKSSGSAYYGSTSKVVRNGDGNVGFTLDSVYFHVGVFLVSDGGTTLSSQLDPSLNANNANSPAADVSTPGLMGLFGLSLIGLAYRRKSHQPV
jgi:hypothetical protein